MAKQRSMEASEPHALYRFYGAGGTLLYIGITNSIPVRLKAHNKDKQWWLGVTNITIEHYPDRRAVLEAERRAIATEHPLYNGTHNPAALTKGVRDRAYYLDWLGECLADGELDRRIADERFLGMPEDLIPIEIACTLVDDYADELGNLGNAIYSLLSALPVDARERLVQLAKDHSVDHENPDYLKGFVAFVAEWMATPTKVGV